MVCTRKTKTLVSTCVILSGMTNIICLLYVGWVTNYIASVYVRGQEPAPDKKLEEDKGDTLKIIERLDHLENVIKQHIQEAPAKPEEAEAEPFTDSSLFAHWGQELSPEGRRVALKQFQYYGYNAYLSDRLPLDRPLPDLRPSGCRNLSFPNSLPEVSIVFIFVNEALSVLLRSIHSAIERTPPHLLKEIILVDDNSSNEELKEKLTEYVDKVNSQKPGFIKVVRHSKQEGLIRSRVSGWRAATAPVVALFDAHVEFNVGWAEPVLTRIKENRKRIISPSFDNIKYDNFEIEEYPLAAQGFDWELWCRYLNPPRPGGSWRTPQPQSGAPPSLAASLWTGSTSRRLACWTKAWKSTEARMWSLGSGCGSVAGAWRSCPAHGLPTLSGPTNPTQRTSPPTSAGTLSGWLKSGWMNLKATSTWHGTYPRRTQELTSGTSPQGRL